MCCVLTVLNIIYNIIFTNGTLQAQHYRAMYSSFTYRKWGIMINGFVIKH